MMYYCLQVIRYGVLLSAGHKVWCITVCRSLGMDGVLLSAGHKVRCITVCRS